MKTSVNKIPIIAIIIIIILIVFAFLYPAICPYKYTAINKGAENLGILQYSEVEKNMLSSKAIFPHLLGTDSLGRDYAVRVAFAIRISVLVGLLSSLLIVIIGTILGAVAGLYGGIIDLVIMRLADIISSVPDIVIILLFSVFGKPIIEKFTIAKTYGVNLVSIFVVFGLLYWCTTARIIRGRVLILKVQTYVMVAKMIGGGRFYIIRKHIIPNCIDLITVCLTLQVPSSILAESMLAFLGLGVQAPIPSLGALVNESYSCIYYSPQKLFIPVVTICLLSISLSRISDWINVRGK